MKKVPNKFTLAMAGLLGFGLSLAAQSDVLAQWEFGSGTGVTTTASDVSASDLTHAGGSFDNGGRSGGGGLFLDGSSYVDDEPIHSGVNSSGWDGPAGRYFARPFDDASITSDTKHFAFDITLDAGVTYDLDKVWFDFGIREHSGNELSVQMSPNSDF